MSHFKYPMPKTKFGVHRYVYRQLRRDIIRGRPKAVQHGGVYFSEDWRAPPPGQRYTLVNLMASYDPLEEAIGHIERNGNWVWAEGFTPATVDKSKARASMEIMTAVYNSEEHRAKYRLVPLEDQS